MEEYRFEVVVGFKSDDLATQVHGELIDAVSAVAYVVQDCGLRKVDAVDVIRDAATRMLHGEDYADTQAGLRRLAMALGVHPDEVEGILPEAESVTFTPEAVRFFYAHAGFGYNPETETAEEGRTRTAEALARAEAYAEHVGWTVTWDDDYEAMFDDRDSEWADWPHYVAALHDRDDEVIGSLSSVMFADRGGPGDGDTYARVVGAELALEAMPS